MGSFSIWHWIIVLILFSPVILGIAIMGIQKRVLIKHTQSNIVKSGYVGYCWTYLLIGWIVPIVRGEIGIGVLHLVLTVVTFGLFQAIMPFLYNKQFMTRHLNGGYALNDTDEVNLLAKQKLNIVG
jgi:hypothetical protein